MKGECLLLLSLFFASSYGIEWTPATYPNPSSLDGSKVCKRPSQSFVCDPDMIISTDSANVVSQSFKNWSYKHFSDTCTLYALNDNASLFEFHYNAAVFNYRKALADLVEVCVASI